MKILKPASVVFFTLLANGLSNYTTSLELLSKTHSTFSFGIGLVTGPLVGLILATPITRLLKKFNNHKLATIGLIGATLSIFIYGWAVNTDNHLFAFAIIFLVFNGAFMRLFNYAYMSNQLYIVGEENIQKLNSLEQGSISILKIINPAIAAIIWGIIGLQQSLFIAVIISLLGIYILKNVTYPTKNDHDHTLSTSDQKKPGFIKTMATIKKHRIVNRIFILESLTGILFVSEIVALPYILVHENIITSQNLGLIQGIIGFGSVIGAIVAYRKKVKHTLSTLKYTTVAVGTLYILLAATFYQVIYPITIIFVAVLGVLIGMLNTFSGPIGYSKLQLVLSDDDRSDVLTWYFTVQELVYPIGSILVSSLLNVISSTTIYLLYGLSIIAIGLLTMKGVNHE